MPLVDMPLEKLEAYKPPLTRRDDFESFWSATVQAALAQPLEAEFEAVLHPARGVEVSRVAFDGFEAGRITGWYLEPEKPGPHPALVIFHGYSGRSPAVLGLLPWVYQGLVVLTVDCRGQVGGSTDGVVYPGGQRPGVMTKGILDRHTYYYRYAYADGVRAVALTASQKMVDAERIAVAGMSQGGGLSLATAALMPKSVKLCAAAAPFLCHYERAVAMAEGAYREIADYVKAWPDRHGRVFETLSYFDNLNLVDRIEGRVLLSAGLWDTVCPPSTVFAVYNHMRCPKQIAVYPFHAHETGDDWDERTFAFLTGGLSPKG